jgi:hypothetical protein
VRAKTFDRAQQRLADNKRYAARNTKVPSLLQSLAACCDRPQAGVSHLHSNHGTSRRT